MLILECGGRCVISVVVFRRSLSLSLSSIRTWVTTLCRGLAVSFSCQLSSLLYSLSITENDRNKAFSFIGSKNRVASSNKWEREIKRLLLHSVNSVHKIKCKEKRFCWLVRSPWFRGKGARIFLEQRNVHFWYGFRAWAEKNQTIQAL